MDIFNPNEGVLEFLLEHVPTVAERLRMNTSETALLRKYLGEAYRNEEKFQKNLLPENANVKNVFLKSTAYSVRLDDLLLNKMLADRKDCVVEGEEYLRDAFEYHRRGGRVVFMSNHIGPIDATVLFRKIRELGAAHGIPLTWIAGQRVWESIYLRIFARYVDLLTIHSQKYLDQAVAENQALYTEMFNHNCAALRYLKEHPNVYLVFPEGTGDPTTGVMHAGVPSTMRILKALGGKFYEDVRMYPYHIKGTQDLVPQNVYEQYAGKIDPFFLFFLSLSKGSVTFRFGPGIDASTLGTTDDERTHATMCAIADLAETEEERGPYAHALRDQAKSIAV